MVNRTEPTGPADQRASAVIAAAIEVHRGLGPGLLESTYEAALIRELELREIPFAQQVPYLVHYKGAIVGEYRVDLVVDGILLLELKSTAAVSDVHIAQTLAYLGVAKLELALILNFGRATLRDGIRRVVRTAN